MKLWHFFIILLFCSFVLYASPYDMILTGDPVIEDIRFLSLEAGIPFLSFTPPFAPHEIDLFLNKINVDNLSPSGIEAYGRIQKRLNPETPLSLSWDNFSIYLNLESTLEAKARTNKEVDYLVNPEIPSLLSLPVRLYFINSIQLYFDPALSIDPQDYSFNSHSSERYYMSNILFLNDNHLNGNTPLKTFIAAGGTFWNFQLGRDQLSYGTGITGNLGIADNPPFYEFMRFSLFSKHLKYSLLVIQSPLHLRLNSENMLIDKEAHPNIDDLFNDGLLDTTTQRYFYLHRLDFTLFDRLSVGIMEGVIVGNSNLEIRYLNPLMIIHNAMTWRDYKIWSDSPDLEQSYMVGSFFSLELNWNIYKSFSIYTQFVMNEIALGLETEEGRNEAPNALGFMAGFQHGFTIKDWSAIAYLESFYTFPFLYLNGSPYASFIYMNNIGITHENAYYYWFGYPRDTFSVSAGTRIRNLNDNMGFSINLSWIASGQKNQKGVNWDFKRSEENFNLTSPSGIVENKYIVSLGTRWNVYSWLTLQSKISGMYFVNNKHIPGENEINGQLSFSAVFRY